MAQMATLATALTPAQQARLASNPGAQEASAVPASAQDRAAVQAYDAAGRLSYSIDSAGYVTGQRYDRAGRLAATTLYDTALSGLGADTSAAEIDSALLAAQASGRTTRYSYDAAGNLASTTDALGYVQSYSYDGAGNQLSRREASGAIWSYGYDAAGRQTSQASPAVLLTSVSTDANGNLVQGSATFECIVTRLDYDALGNVLARTEAAGRAEQRTIRYDYDTLGHLVKTTFPPVGVYESEDLASLVGSGPGEAARTERQATLSTTVTYDDDLQKRWLDLLKFSIKVGQ